MSVPMHVAVYLPSLDLTAKDVLHAFQWDAPSLFLGSAIIAVGLVAAAFSAIRRKHDLVLIYFALFAILYGLRMWMQSSLMSFSMHGSIAYERVTHAIDFIVPLPAFLYFKAAGLVKRQAEIATYLLGIVLGSCALATILFGARPMFYRINNIFIILTLVFMAVRSVRHKSEDQDLVVLRRGLLIFIAFVLWENFQSVIGLNLPFVEPIGFVAFLTALGFVAARQILQRDRQLGELQNELEIAKRIQLSILPGAFPASVSFRVAARYVPMTAVAGDFYDFLVADEAQAGLLIADVSGHGVPAALIASMVKVAATSQRGKIADPAGLLAGMNMVLRGNTRDQFVTAAYVQLDAAVGRLQYSAAGHPPMLRLRNGNVTEISENGLMLAAFESAAYTNASHLLEAGDRIVLYTDGLIEAENARGDFFGPEALAERVCQTAGLTPDSAADEIISAVKNWAVAQADDLTIIVCDYLGVSAA